MEDIKAYMSIAELAERVGVQPRTIMKYIRTQPEKLPATYVFLGRPKFKRSEVEAWEESCRRSK